MGCQKLPKIRLQLGGGMGERHINKDNTQPTHSVKAVGQLH